MSQIVNRPASATLDIQDPDWYKALTLSERVAAGVRLAKPDDALLQKAEKKLKTWRDLPIFADDSDYFARRLEMDKIDEATLLALAIETPAALRERLSTEPEWLENLGQTFSNPDWQAGKSLLEILREQEQKLPNSVETEHVKTTNPLVGFLDLIQPLIRKAQAQVRNSLERIYQQHGRQDLPFDPQTIEEVLFLTLPPTLITVMSRTMTLELHVARLRGILKGETSEARFESFIEYLRQPENSAGLLKEYPVLARELALFTEQWATHTGHFIERLVADWTLICSKLNRQSSAPGLLIELDGGAGDQHQGGQSVLLAKFSSGFQLVYKPRLLGVDVHFQELLEWLNSKGVQPAFRKLEIIEREKYGWVEFIAAQPCNNEAEISRFYQRQGAYLALLYAIEATDFHLENLIACGEYPMLIDLESLFHPHIDGLEQLQTPAKADMLAGSTIAYSVLRVGLLPNRTFISKNSEGIELSGLGGAAGQLTPQPMLQLENAGTDESHFSRKRLEMPAAQNRTSLNGAEINAQNHTDEIVAGFNQVYRLLMEHTTELLAADGPLARFAQDEVRVIARPTYIYARLLQESYHPDMLRDALNREQIFNRLWVDLKYIPVLDKFISSERASLHQGDIPMFLTQPGTLELRNTWGEVISGVCKQTGLELVFNRIQKLTQEDLETQEWFIRASMTTLSMGTEQARLYSYTPVEPQTQPSPEKCLKIATEIGDWLKKRALTSENEVTWIGVTYINELYWTLMPLGLDLYNGLPGVALYLAYLSEITGQPDYAETARAALRTMQQQIKQVETRIPLIGGFDGWGGIIYCLSHLGQLWNDQTLLDEAYRLVSFIEPLLLTDNTFDIINGASGCLLSLLSLYQVAPTQVVLECMRKCGNRLVEQARPMERGVGWAGLQEKPMSGFSHGCAGIAYSLLELYQITGEPQYKSTALAALEYERSLFSAELNNWLDLREITEQFVNVEQPESQSTWCHGAPGIGMARLATLKQLDDPTIRAEIEVALKTTLTEGFGLNHSLCHGDLGNIEVVLQASQALSEPRWQEELSRLNAIILESIEREGWLCGVPLKVITPSLMTGIAGIGWGLLRLADASKIPSVLLLQPPIK